MRKARLASGSCLVLWVNYVLDGVKSFNDCHINYTKEFAYRIRGRSVKLRKLSIELPEGAMVLYAAISPGNGVGVEREFVTWLSGPPKKCFDMPYIFKPLHVLKVTITHPKGAKSHGTK